MTRHKFLLASLALLVSCIPRTWTVTPDEGCGSEWVEPLRQAKAHWAPRFDRGRRHLYTACYERNWRPCDDRTYMVTTTSAFTGEALVILCDETWARHPGPDRTQLLTQALGKVLGEVPVR